MYQEPCCIERTLPILLRQYGYLPWQSNGDITLEKIVKAVAHLAGNSITISLCLPVIDIAALRLLRWLFNRGWLKQLYIITTEDQAELIRAEIPAELLLTIANHASITDATASLLVITGEVQTVIVQGPLHTTIAASPTRENFSTYAGKDPDRIAQFTDTLTSLFRVATRKKSKNKQETAPSSSISGDAIADPASTDPEAAVPDASPSGSTPIQ